MGLTCIAKPTYTTSPFLSFIMYRKMTAMTVTMTTTKYEMTAMTVIMTVSHHNMTKFQ